MRWMIAVLIVLLWAPPALAQGDPGCVGDVDAVDVVAKPTDALLRFGVTPGVQTGQLGIGAVPPRTPEDPQRHLAALDVLRAPGKDLVLRLHRFFWSDGEEGIRRFLALADRYTSRGYLVELQLRYHPTPEQEGDIAAWVAYVREVVRRFGTNPRVVAIQVTNEVNLTWSPDSSDGAYEGAREALVQGVIAAKDEATRIASAVEIGFNWAYRMDPATEQSFWQGVRDRGGARFVESVDWVGLDAYPGTFFPPAEGPGGERDGMVNAMSALRCYLKVPGIPESVPIHVEENGWPTSPTRSEARQVEAMDLMVGAVHEFRGTYNVTDYRWFNLRDGDSTSPNMGVRYGLLRDDYSEKPGFRRFAEHVATLARAAERVAAQPLALRLRTRCHRGRFRLRLGGRCVAQVRRVLFRAGQARRVDRRRPFTATVRPPRHGNAARAAVRLRDGRRLRLVRLLPPCVRAS